MVDSKKILIISYHFAPQNKIGAVRMTKLAKYLSRLGYKVTVLCSAGREELRDPTLVRDLEELHDVHVIREWNLIRDRKERAAVAQHGQAPADPPKLRRRTGGFVYRFLRTLYLALDQLSDASFYRRGFREIMSTNRRFDVVLSSYGPLSNHRIARRLKEEGIARQWIADFRDEVALPFRWQAGMARRYVRKVGEQADGVNAVSRGVLQVLGFQDRGKCIPNGFDREDLERLRSLSLPGSPLIRFAHCGKLYSGKQNLTPLLTILSKFLREGLLQPGEAQVLYAGDGGAVMAAQALTAGVEQMVYDLGMLDRGQSLSLQRQADVLLIALWNSQERIGVLSGKLLEYMMMEKAVICCVPGEVPGSEIKRVMEEIGLGFCWEQARAESDTPALEGYLREMISRARQGRVMGPTVNAAAVERYAYSQIAREFSEWIEKKGR